MKKMQMGALSSVQLICVKSFKTYIYVFYFFSIWETQFSLTLTMKPKC